MSDDVREFKNSTQFNIAMRNEKCVHPLYFASNNKYFFMELIFWRQTFIRDLHKSNFRDNLISSTVELVLDLYLLRHL